jgi:hypothetical protein
MLKTNCLIPLDGAESKQHYVGCEIYGDTKSRMREYRSGADETDGNKPTTETHREGIDAKMASQNHTGFLFVRSSTPRPACPR